MRSDVPIVASVGLATARGSAAEILAGGARAAPAPLPWAVDERAVCRVGWAARGVDPGLRGAARWRALVRAALGECLGMAASDGNADGPPDGVPPDGVPPTSVLPAAVPAAVPPSSLPPLVIGTCSGAADDFEPGTWGRAFDAATLVAGTPWAGTAVPVLSASCASGLQALFLGCRLLDAGAPEVVVLAADVLSPAGCANFEALRVLAAGREVPWQRTGTGFLPGEAAVALRLVGRKSPVAYSPGLAMRRAAPQSEPRVLEPSPARPERAKLRPREKVAPLQGGDFGDLSTRGSRRVADSAAPAPGSTMAPLRGVVRWGLSGPGLDLDLAGTGGLERALAGLAVPAPGVIFGQGTGPWEADREELAALERALGEKETPLATPLYGFGHTLGASGLLSLALAVLRARGGGGEVASLLAPPAARAADGRPLWRGDGEPEGDALVVCRALGGSCAVARLGAVEESRWAGAHPTGTVAEERSGAAVGGERWAGAHPTGRVAGERSGDARAEERWAGAHPTGADVGVRSGSAGWGEPVELGPFHHPFLRRLAEEAPAQRPATPPAALVVRLVAPLAPPARAVIGGRLLPSAVLEITPGQIALTIARAWGFRGPALTLVGAGEAGAGAFPEEADVAVIHCNPENRHVEWGRATRRR